MKVHDPERLLDSAEAGDLERLLLESGDIVDPLPAEREAVWQALSRRLPAGGAGVAARLGWIGAWKGALLVLLTLGAVGASAWWLRSPASPPPAIVAPIAIARPEATASTLTPAPVLAPAPAIAPAPAPAPVPAPRRAHAVAPPRSAPSSAPDPLVAESELVLQARRALRAGRTSDALDRLDEARSRFPNGALAQERDALAVEALARAGRGDEAAERAAAFLRAYEGSPYAASVERFAR